MKSHHVVVLLAASFIVGIFLFQAPASERGNAVAVLQTAPGADRGTLATADLVATTTAVAASSSTKSEPIGQEQPRTSVTVYKAPTCGCCEGYIAYLKHEGFDVTVVNERLPTVKERYRIPSDLWSCHTTLVEGYAVEGHVPFEVIRKLLDEKPSFDAIALPAMPSGTPGMPGPKRDPWKIYSVVNGVASEYMTL